jgi:hypothetical protein
MKDITKDGHVLILPLLSRQGAEGKPGRKRLLKNSKKRIPRGLKLARSNKKKDLYGAAEEVAERVVFVG